MIWLTWRQHRMGMLVLVLALAGMAVLLVQDGLPAYTAYFQVTQGTSLAMCVKQNSQDAICQALRTNFFQTYKDPALTPLPLILVPLLVGMFLGAPLVASEIERGTYRLVWMQSVTRLRWLLVKVGAPMGMILLALALINPLVMWWNGPFDRLGGGVGPVSFDLEGIVPLAYMAYALSLAIAAGAVLRKTVPAMAVTLGGYLAARIPIEIWARPHYAPPLSTTWDPYITAPKVVQGSHDWILFENFVDHSGHPFPDPQKFRLYDACAASGVPQAPTFNDLPTACTHAHGWLYMVIWQPADRFWLFQGIESAIFFGLAAALLAFWWVRSRII